MDVDYNVQTDYRRSIFAPSEDYILRAVSYDDSRTDRGVVTFCAVTGAGSCAKIEVRFLTERIFELRLYQTDETWHPIAPLRKQKRVFDFDADHTGTCIRGCKGSYVKTELLDRPDFWIFRTGAAELAFRKEYWQMTASAGGVRILEEEITDTNVDNRWKMLPLGFSLQNGRSSAVRENLKLGSEEAIWGLGEKYTSMNRRGRVYQIRQTDALSTDSEKSYLGQPFYISSKGYGLFLNTFTESSFDVGASSELSLQIRTEDEDLDYVCILEGEGKYKEIVRDYVRLTGGVPLIPRWAFGYWQSKCSYNTRAEVEEVAEKASELGLPLDVIHIDNWQGPQQAGTFRWNETAFPDPAGMIEGLHQRHIHLSVWNYPYVDTICPEFSELEKKGYFVKNKDGKTALFHATADSETCVACFDFTNPEMVTWYQERIRKVLADGVDVIKTDFSEALPADAVLYDGSTGAEAHNKIPYLYTNLVYDTMMEAFAGTDRLPLIYSRSGYLGANRVPAVWAGDSSSESAGLSAILHGGMGLSACGVAFWGYDLGGFFHTSPKGNECLPTEEQYLRSVVPGLFMPLARTHGKTAREPWNISSRALEVTRKYDILRHRLLPYWWQTALEAHEEGIPMLRPLYMEFPEDPGAGKTESEFMIGDSLLVAPAFERDHYSVYLPEGKWINFFTGETEEGGRYVKVSPAIDEIPVYVRNGSVIGIYPEKTGASMHVPEENNEKADLWIYTDHPFETLLYSAEYHDKTGYEVTGHKVIVLKNADGSFSVPEEIRQQYRTIRSDGSPAAKKH